MAKKKHDDGKTPLHRLKEQLDEIAEQHFVDRMGEMVKSIERRLRMVTHSDEDRIHAVCMAVAAEFRLLETPTTFPKWLGYVVKGIGRERGIGDG